MKSAQAELDLSYVANLSRRWLSPTLFALIALCFLLPFATVSCDQASTTFTGLQLVTRTVPQGGVLDEAPDCSSDISACVERESSLTAQVALGLALVGLALGLLGVVKGPGWVASATLGALGALALEPFDMLGPDITLHSGMKLALLLAAAVTAVHGRRAWRRRRPRRKHSVEAEAGPVRPEDALPDARRRIPVGARGQGSRGPQEPGA